MNQKEIGRIIKERRKHLGVNQQILADLAGVGINTLVAIDTNTCQIGQNLLIWQVLVSIRLWLLREGTVIRSFLHFSLF